MRNSLPILLIDDDSMDAVLFKRATDNLKITNPVVHLTTCRKGLDYLKDPKNKKPWIVITDLNTPQMDGIEFLRIIKSDKVLKRIPVVVLTTSKDRQDIIKTFKLNVAGYMVKAVDYKKFVEMIRTINLYWTQSELPNGG